MELFGALQSLGSRLASIFPNIILRKIYSEAYFRSRVLINMGDSTPSLYLHPDESRLSELQVAITNLLPFKLEINFNKVEIYIGQSSSMPISMNQTHDILRISRQTQLLAFGDVPKGLLKRVLESENPHPIIRFDIFYRVRHMLWTFNGSTQLSAAVRIYDYTKTVRENSNPKSKRARKSK